MLAASSLSEIRSRPFRWPRGCCRTCTFVRCRSSSSARQRVLAIEIQRAPLSGAQRFVKRIMDIFVACLALIFFLPVMVLTAIAIKLDSPGPVIFRQARKGFNGRQFVMFKFRTMTVRRMGQVWRRRRVTIRG